MYLTCLEAARSACWRHVFAGFDTTRDAFILARVECDFRASAVMGDELEVRLRVDRIGRSSVDFEGEIVRPADSTCLLESRAVMVMYDYAASTSVPIPETTCLRLEEFER